MSASPQKITPNTARSSLDTPFVVLLAATRSGTHLLRGILTSDPTINDTGENFRPNNFDRPHGAANFWRFLRDQWAEPGVSPLTVAQREAQWRAYLAFLANMFPSGLKILDFKYNNLRSADVGFLWPEEAPTMLRLAIKDRIPIIQLKRRNHLEVVCSIQLAHRTGEWVRPKKIGHIDKAGAAVPIRVDPTALLNTLSAMQRREEIVDSWVQGYDRRIELSYENLLVDGRISSRVVEDVERLVDRKIKPDLEVRTQKISPPLGELIENYEEVEKVLAGTPYATFLSRKTAGYSAAVGRMTTEPVAEHKELRKSAWLSIKILSARPLVTLSAISHDDLRVIDLLAESTPEVFDTARALHLLHMTWTLENDRVRRLADNINDAQKSLPGHIILPLTATENETFLLAQQGIPSLLASGLIFVDERIWRPGVNDIPGLPMFDAIYVARLDPFKRHELAQGVDRLLLAYSRALSQSQSDSHERVRNILPKAYFANHELAGGGDLEPNELCRLHGHSRVGLCLSAVEGCMRASMEYLLSGLPVVSTPSIGGRDRYYAAPYCRIADPNPDAVAGAVRDLSIKNLDRQKIRKHVAQMVGFDRYNFLKNVNKIAKLHLSRDDLIPTMAPMIGAIAKFRSLSEMITTIRSEFNGLINRS